MQQDAALKQRKSCLSIGAAFDPLHFVDESFDHPTHEMRNEMLISSEVALDCSS